MNKKLIIAVIIVVAIIAFFTFIWLNALSCTAIGLSCPGEPAVNELFSCKQYCPPLKSCIQDSDCPGKLNCITYEDGRYCLNQNYFFFQCPEIECLTDDNCIENGCPGVCTSVINVGGTLLEGHCSLPSE